MPYPGAKTFEQAWQEVHGNTPNSIHPMLFMSVWSAVEAIDQSGGDREVIAKLVRSGKFGWESPAGPLVFDTAGEPNVRGIIAIIKDGKGIPAP